MSVGSLRARVRAEMIEEIKSIARRHLASEGANLSLRAVAREMGIVSSALYRYFANRDELLTALIVDAYGALADAAEAADAAVENRLDLLGRWLAVCHAVRRWAVAHPAEYALLFGSPVPGYAAPQDTIPNASRLPAALLAILSDGMGTDAEPAADAGDVPEEIRPDLARAGDAVAPGLPPGLLAVGSIGWIHLFGAVSFEVFGQLNNVVEAREDYFDYQIRRIAGLIGLQPLSDQNHTDTDGPARGQEPLRP
jgi:AcrR family transcriptional regulator